VLKYPSLIYGREDLWDTLEAWAMLARAFG
jgi:hypothetical protein